MWKIIWSGNHRTAFICDHLRKINIFAPCPGNPLFVKKQTTTRKTTKKKLYVRSCSSFCNAHRLFCCFVFLHFLYLRTQSVPMGFCNFGNWGKKVTIRTLQLQARCSAAFVSLNCVAAPNYCEPKKVPQTVCNYGRFPGRKRYF